MRKLRSIVAGSNLDLINRATPLSQLASRSLPDQSSAFYRTKVASKILTEHLIGGIVDRELRAVSRPPPSDTESPEVGTLDRLPHKFVDFHFGVTRPICASCKINALTLW
jgi:hypothetical protein